MDLQKFYCMFWMGEIKLINRKALEKLKIRVLLKGINITNKIPWSQQMAFNLHENKKGIFFFLNQKETAVILCHVMRRVKHTYFDNSKDL